MDENANSPFAKTIKSIALAKLASLPLAILKLKIEMPIIYLRNLNLLVRLINSTRIIVTSIRK